MLLKLIFLIAYFILVFTLARVIDVCWSFVNIFRIDDIAFASHFPFSWNWRKGYQDVKDFGQVNDFQENEVFLQDAQVKKGSFLEETVFHTYEEYLESVEDTKSSVWVVKLYPIKKQRHIILDSEWLKLRMLLWPFKIKTAVFDCSLDPRLCVQFKTFQPTFVLSMPKGFQTKGNVSFFIFDKAEQDLSLKEVISSKDLLNWVKKKLYLRIRRVHSISEVTFPVKARHRTKDNTEPSLSFIYKSNSKVPPMFLTALSVKFSGRVKFYLFQNDKESHASIALSKYESYSYGGKKGENFSYSCLELFLQTLHPEVNDIFIVSIVLINMACWLELFLQKGGPLRRLFYYVWGFTVTNILLVFLWLPIIQIICLPQVQPLIHIILKTLQKIMLTNLAAVVRQDILQVSQHIHVLLAGFVFYGIVLGYIRLKMRNDRGERSSLTLVLSEDIEEFHETVSSFLQFMTPSLRIYRFEERVDSILRRLMYPDLWLHDTRDYINDLPKWQKCKCESNESDFDLHPSDTDYSDLEDKLCIRNCSIPTYIIPSDECAICLELYICRDLIMGISCGHSFHEKCLLAWLLSSNSQRRCPICRWPADVAKGEIELVDLQD